MSRGRTGQRHGPFLRRTVRGLRLLSTGLAFVSFMLATSLPVSVTAHGFAGSGAEGTVKLGPVSGSNGTFQLWKHGAPRYTFSVSFLAVSPANASVRFQLIHNDLPVVENVAPSGALKVAANDTSDYGFRWANLVDVPVDLRYDISLQSPPISGEFLIVAGVGLLVLGAIGSVLFAEFFPRLGEPTRSEVRRYEREMTRRAAGGAQAGKRTERRERMGKENPP